MNLDKTVCYCMGVTNGKIKNAVDQGAMTLEEVMKATKAGTVCGACRSNLAVLVEYFIEEKHKES